MHLPYTQFNNRNKLLFPSFRVYASTLPNLPYLTYLYQGQQAYRSHCLLFYSAYINL